MKLSRLAAAGLLLLSLLLAACGGSQTREPRELSLYEYASAIRWSEFETAASFLDPLELAAKPLSDLERERFKQVQVTGYLVKLAQPVAEDRYEQVVEIRLINRHTQTERVITDRQRWRFDPLADRWWLMSGLPDLDAAID